MRKSLVLPWFLVSCISGLASTGSSCTPTKALKDGRISDGMYSTTLQSRCTVSGDNLKRIAELHQRLRSHLANPVFFALHAKPVATAVFEFQGETFDVTDIKRQQENHIAIRQNVFLGMNPEGDSLFYDTRSSKIEGSGTAAYLRSVDFQARVHRNSEALVLDFRNSVRVEQPWFALSVLFRSISDKISVEKFELARDSLLKKLEEM